MDIIIFSLSRSDASISSPSFSLAKEFAKTGRVFYIDHPYSLKDLVKGVSSVSVRKRLLPILFGKHKYNRYSDNLITVTTKLTIPINFLPAGKLYNSLSHFNDSVVFQAIRGIIKDFKVKDFVYFNAFDPFFAIEFPADIKPVMRIYQSMDDMSEVSYTAKHGLRLEEKIIRNFDFTLVTSRELHRLKSQISPNIYLHHNAADIDLFTRALDPELERPEELKNIKGPIIGYTGNICSRIDYELLRKVALANPDKHLVLVGPLSSKELSEQGIDKMQNVILTGPKRIDELPQYLKFFDCALIPFKCNTLTRSIYPLKINEYLAAGKSVVATSFSEDIRSFADVIYVGENHDDFIRKVGIAVSENSAADVERRLNVARQNSWEARAAQFWSYIEKSGLKEAV